MTDLLRGACPLAQQLHQLPIQNINVIPQFFQRHSILVVRPACQVRSSLFEKPVSGRQKSKS
jgi:hypothetical protein